MGVGPIFGMIERFDKKWWLLVENTIVNNSLKLQQFFWYLFKQA